MGAQRPSHHESREAVPIVQATSKVGIVIDFTRFGTVPDAMIVIVLQLENRSCVERLWGKSTVACQLTTGAVLT